MTVEGVQIVVDVATLELGSCKRRNIRTVSVMTKTGDRQEAKSLHIATAFKTIRDLVKFVVIPDMGVTAKESNRSVPCYITNGLEDGVRLARVRDRNMSSNDEKVNIFVTNGILEPLLLGGILYSLNDSVVCITLEVEEEAKGHDPNTLVLCGKLSESLGERLQLPSFWVVDVQVGGDVGLLEIGHSVIVFIIGRVLLIEFMVARGDDVYLLVFENVKGVVSFGI